MGNIRWTDRVKSEEVLHRVKGYRNIVHTVNRRKANYVGHILRRNCLLKHVIEGKIEGSIDVAGRRGRGRKQLLGDLKETRRDFKLKDEAQDGTLWRIRFGRVCGSVGKTGCEMNDISCAVQIMKLLFYASFPAPCYVIPLRPLYFPQHPFFEGPQHMSLPQFEIPSFTPVQNNR
jgi:hypothetical protein